MYIEDDTFAVKPCLLNSIKDPVPDPVGSGTFVGSGSGIIVPDPELLFRIRHEWERGDKFKFYL